MLVAPASRAARTTALELLGRVGDAGQDRRHPDAGLHPRVDERRQRLEPPARGRRPGLGAPPDLLVERRHREDDPDLRALRAPRRARRGRGRSSGCA